MQPILKNVFTYNQALATRSLHNCTYMRNSTKLTEWLGISLFFFFTACSIPCLPVGGICDAQQDAKCVKLDHVQVITHHYVRVGMLKKSLGNRLFYHLLDSIYWDKGWMQWLLMFPLLLKCVYVCKTAHKEHFFVQIHLLLKQQPQILIKNNNIF